MRTQTLSVLAMAILVAVSLWVYEHAAAIEHVAELAAITITAAAIIGLAAITGLSIRNHSLRHIPAAAVARLSWRHLTRNTGLARPDAHRADQIRRGRQVKPKVINLRARIRPTADGIRATVRTIPGTSRAEIDDAAEHIRNQWKCERVQVEQAGPRKVVIHGLRSDPLTQPTTHLDVPAGTFGRTDPPSSLYLGRDTAGRHRSLPLAGVTGITVAGLPGLGKSSLLNGWLCQLAPSPFVRFALLDGKGGGDYQVWRDRAWLYVEDELADALAVLEDVHAEMQRRLGSVLELTGKRNAWHVGPTEAMPLLVVPIDECQSYLDVASYKGDPAKEAMARRCQALTGRVIRKGRSVLCQVWLATQKPTSDSLPTQLRDNCALSVSYGLKTTDGAVAALGEAIRQFPTYNPTQFGPGDEGVCAATICTGTDPFALLRTPEISDSFAADTAMATAHLCRVPEAVKV